MWKCLEDDAVLLCVNLWLKEDLDTNDKTAEVYKHSHVHLLRHI